MEAGSRVQPLPSSSAQPAPPRRGPAPATLGSPAPAALGSPAPAALGSPAPAALGSLAPAALGSPGRARRRGREPDQLPVAPSQCRITVSGYPDYTQPQDLIEVFSKFGTVRIDKSNSWSSTLTYTSEEAVKAAVSANKRLQIYGHWLAVKPYIAKASEESRPAQPTTPKREFPMSKLKVVPTLLLVCGVLTVLGEQLCLVGDFESQVRFLQRRVMLSPSDIANASRVFDDVRRTLRRRWKDAEIFPYGSLATGVAMKTSDADCTYKIPEDNETSQLALVSKVSKLFSSQPELYSQVMYKIYTHGHVDGALLTVYHIPTGRYCDLTYYNVLGLKSSRLFSYFIKLDERVPPLVSILKFWSRIHQITGPGVLTNYGLYTLIMFYLQQKKIGPPVFVLQKDFRNNYNDTWNLRFNEIPYNTTNTESLYQLLGGFFKYYSEFDFKEYIVSPFVGRPLHRRDFTDIKNVPAEFSLYKAYMMKNVGEPLDITTDICIQEPLEHNTNSAKRVTGEYTSNIISHFKFCAKMFEQLSSDRFLRSILIKDKHNEKYNRAKKVVLDTISKLEDCINGTMN